MLKTFRDLGELPVDLKLTCDIVVDDLVQNKAKWHKSCNLKFCASKLAKAIDRKRKRIEEDVNGPVEKKRKRTSGSSKDNCILCDKGNGQLHDVSSFTTNKNFCK